MNPFFVLGLSFFAGILLGGFALNLAIYFTTLFLRDLVECFKLCAAMLRSASGLETCED